MTAASAKPARKPILKLLRLSGKSKRGERKLGEGLRLEGTMVPRRVKRLFDQRGEPRATITVLGELECRGTTCAVRTANLSASGAMIEYATMLHIGERVTLTLPGEAPRQAIVRWVRGGRIGLHFNASVG